MDITWELTICILELILHNASEQDLIAMQNPAYMHLFTENIKLTGHLEVLEYIHCLSLAH